MNERAPSATTASASFHVDPTSLFLVLSGPAGAGKTTLIRKWLHDCPDLKRVPSVTTRRRRPPTASSPDEVEYYEFVSVPRFREMVEAGAFAQWSNPSEGVYYGTPMVPLRQAIADRRDLVFDFTPELLINLRRQFRQEVVGIFVVPPTLAELEQRLKARGTEQGLDLHIKWQMALQDIGFSDEHEYHVVNHQVDAALADLKSIRAAEHRRLARAGRAPDAWRRVGPGSMLSYYDPLSERIAAMVVRS